jgi:type VI protein secretion system component VasK
MHIDQIVALAGSHFLSRIIRRAVAAVLLTIFAIVAVYHFTVAGEIALAEPYGILNAQLIVGGIYAALALISLVVFWAMGHRNGTHAAAPALSHNARELQLVMLVEAVMLGYSLAQKRERAG